MPRQCNGSARVRELYSTVEIVICDTTLCAEAVQLIAVRTAGWWFQQAAQRLRAVSNRGPQAARRGFGDGPGLAEAVV